MWHIGNRDSKENVVRACRRFAVKDMQTARANNKISLQTGSGLLLKVMAQKWLRQYRQTGTHKETS